MDNFLANIIAGLTVPALAIAFNIAFERWLVGRTKEVVAHLANGRNKTFTVHANASDAQIVEVVGNGLTLERDVFRALNRLQLGISGLEVRYGAHVDFVVEMPTRKVAIECKINVDQIDDVSVERQLSLEDDISELLLVVREPVPANLLVRTRRLIDAGKLKLVIIEESDELEGQLSAAMGIATT